MNKYAKGKKVIFATEKAYELIYKEQGFVPFSEKETKANKSKDAGTEKKDNNGTNEEPEKNDENSDNPDVTEGE